MFCEISLGSACPSGLRCPDRGDDEAVGMVNVYSTLGKARPVTVTADSTAFTVLTSIKPGKEDQFSIIERLPDLDLERRLEDHEKILPILRDWKAKGVTSNRFVYCETLDKYSLFTDPLAVLDTQVCTIDLEYKANHSVGTLTNQLDYVRLFHTLDMDMNVIAFENLRKKPSQRNEEWIESNYVFKNDKFYVGEWGAANVMSNPSRMEVVLNDVAKFNYYYHEKDKLERKEYGQFCLKPDQFADEPIGEDTLHHFRSRKKTKLRTWIELLRLSKHGEVLRENFLQYLERQSFTLHAMSSFSERTLIAMQVSTDVLKFATQIGEAGDRQGDYQVRGTQQELEARALKIATNPQLRISWFNENSTNKDYLDEYAKRKRPEQGTAYVCNGNSEKGTFVISYYHIEKWRHFRVLGVDADGERDYSFSPKYFRIGDSGYIFHDLLQLVEFYQLNTEHLPGHISYYIGKKEKLLYTTGEPLQIPTPRGPTPSTSFENTPSGSGDVEELSR